MQNCPCCSGMPFADCCEPLLNGAKNAASPEALMRSRYTAFHTKNMSYIENTTDPQGRAETDWNSTRAWAEQSDFIKLEILGSSEEKNKGTVEFKAHFTPAGSSEPQIHHEQSTFRKHGGIWYFRSGKPGSR